MKNRHHDGIYQLKPIASITAGMIECTTIHSNEAQNYCRGFNTGDTPWIFFARK